MAKDKVPAAIAAASRTVDLPEPLMPAMTVRFELKLTSMSEKHLKYRNLLLDNWSFPSKFHNYLKFAISPR